MHLLWTGAARCAGALKDNCRALLVGGRTYGKGLIQSIYELHDASGLALTVPPAAITPGCPSTPAAHHPRLPPPLLLAVPPHCASSSTLRHWCARRAAVAALCQPYMHRIHFADAAGMVFYRPGWLLWHWSASRFNI